ncbi:hypothetical protein J6590_028055 [Homalodisca vitripennis]|nr:hypothetical protein J6590_028055 [Homalodisca vitripennis]
MKSDCPGQFKEVECSHTLAMRPSNFYRRDLVGRLVNPTLGLIIDVSDRDIGDQSKSHQRCVCEVTEYVNPARMREVSCIESSCVNTGPFDHSSPITHLPVELFHSLRAMMQLSKRAVTCYTPGEVVKKLLNEVVQSTFALSETCICQELQFDMRIEIISDWIEYPLRCNRIQTRCHLLLHNCRSSPLERARTLLVYGCSRHVCLYAITGIDNSYRLAISRAPVTGHSRWTPITSHCYCHMSQVPLSSHVDCFSRVKQKCHTGLSYSAGHPELACGFRTNGVQSYCDVDDSVSHYDSDFLFPLEFLASVRLSALNREKKSRASRKLRLSAASESEFSLQRSRPDITKESAVSPPPAPGCHKAAAFLHAELLCLYPGKHTVTFGYVDKSSL